MRPHQRLCSAEKCESTVPDRAKNEYALCSAHRRAPEVRVGGEVELILRWCYYCKKAHTVSEFGAWRPLGNSKGGDGRMLPMPATSSTRMLNPRFSS